MRNGSTFLFLIDVILNSSKYTEDERQLINFDEILTKIIEIENTEFSTVANIVKSSLESLGFIVKKEEVTGSVISLLAIRGKRFQTFLSSLIAHGEHGERLGAKISISNSNPIKIIITVDPYMELRDLPEEDGFPLSQDFDEKYSDDVASMIAVNNIAIKILSLLDQIIPNNLKDFYFFVIYGE